MSEFVCSIECGCESEVSEYLCVCERESLVDKSVSE